MKTRAMCTASSGLVKPPVQMFGLEGRYATALYSAASKMQQLDQVEKDLSSFQTALRSDKKLREMVVSPIVNKSTMGKALRETANQARMASATGNFLGLLADNGRLSALDGVINSFQVIMAAHRGEVVCEVVTAKPLDAAQNKQLEGALKVSKVQSIELILINQFCYLGFFER